MKKTLSVAFDPDKSCAPISTISKKCSGTSNHGRQFSPATVHESQPYTAILFHMMCGAIDSKIGDFY